MMEDLWTKLTQIRNRLQTEMIKLEKDKIILEKFIIKLQQTTQKLRAESKKCGWYTNGTHDYCPNCWTKRHDGKMIRYLKARFLEKIGRRIIHPKDGE